MSISSIDELLMGGNTSQQPMSPEEKIDIDKEPEPIEEVEEEAVEYEEEQSPEEEAVVEEVQEKSSSDGDKDTSSPEYDEYGNEKERMSKGMKERLDRKERQHQKEIEQREREIEALRVQLSHQGASPQVQQAAKDFEYDPDASGDWQHQLAQFVKQTVNSMTRDEKEKQLRSEEAKVQQEFEVKFRHGMDKFQDFTDVISDLSFEITNPMTLATRAMADPAAFLYAAAKRNPQELERISKLRDPYAQMTEMGKLEERMRKNKPTTKAPRPIGRSVEDSPSKVISKQKETSGDDLLAKADAKRLSTVKQRHRGNR